MPCTARDTTVAANVGDLDTWVIRRCSPMYVVSEYGSQVNPLGSVVVLNETMIRRMQFLDQGDLDSLCSNLKSTPGGSPRVPRLGGVHEKLLSTEPCSKRQNDAERIGHAKFQP